MECDVAAVDHRVTAEYLRACAAECGFAMAH